MAMFINAVSAGFGESAQSSTRPDFLFESVVCDLHLTALSVGAIATLLNARVRMAAQWTLKSWRPLFDDDSQAMRLTLRFHAEMGMPGEVAARIGEFYAGLGRAKTAYIEQKHASDGAAAALLHADEDWRRLCRAASAAVQAAAPEAKRRLPDAYSEDARTLAAFLEAAAKGDASRVNGSGEITLPRLRQRRSAPRAAVRHGCMLLLPDGRASAEIEDVSRNGMGVVCRHPLREGQEVVVELSGGRKLKAVVARRAGDQVGLRLSVALAANDPLFRGEG